MIANPFKELAAAKAKVARLEKIVSRRMKAELAALPGRFGFADVSSFIKAVKSTVGGRRGRPRAKAEAGSPIGKRPRKRGVITDAKRAKVKAMVEAGRTGPAIANALKISEQSVHNIKKALGLVKTRK